MAEGDATGYNNLFEQLMLKTLDFVNDAFKIALLGSGYSPTYTGNPGYANLTDEITASNYSAGGKAISGKSVTQNDTANQATWDSNDLTWTSLGATSIAHAVLYDDTITTPVADPLLIHWEITTNSNGNNYTLLTPNGLMVIS